MDCESQTRLIVRKLTLCNIQLIIYKSFITDL